MRHNIIKIAFTGVLLTGLVSCSDFLNRPAEDTYNVDNFYENDDQCIQGVNYLYNSPWFDFQRAFLWVGEVLSGNLYMGNSQYQDFSLNGTDTDLVNMSYSLWSVNAHANTVIYNIRTDRRYREPYLDVHLPGEFLDLYDIFLIGNRELVAIEEDAVRLE